MKLKYTTETYILDQIIHQIETGETNIGRYDERMILEIELRRDELLRERGEETMYFRPYNNYIGNVPEEYQRRMADRHLYQVTFLMLTFVLIISISYLLFWPTDYNVYTKLLFCFLTVISGFATIGIMLALSNYRK